jgi:hypothetical protein
MTVIRLGNRQLTRASSLTASRANRDGIVDIGEDVELRRSRAAERLEDALRMFRTVHDSSALAEVLEQKLAAERRLVSRELRRSARGCRQAAQLIEEARVLNEQIEVLGEL